MPEQLIWHVAGFALNANSLIFSWVAMAIVFILFRLAARGADVENPRGLQNLVEMTFEFVTSFIRETVNEEQGRRLFRLLVALLLFLLTANMIDLLPIPVMHTATADPNVTIGLALVVMVLIHYYGFVYRGVGGHLSSFTKPFWLLAPINVMEQFTNPTTLAMRLFGNIFAGDLLIGIASSIAPKVITIGGGILFIVSVALQLGVLGFNTFINIIQAYIFMMLTLAYVGQSMRPADEH